MPRLRTAIAASAAFIKSSALMICIHMHIYIGGFSSKGLTNDLEIARGSRRFGGCFETSGSDSVYMYACIYV